MDKKITKCRVLTSCDQLEEGDQGDCGYCAYDKEFRYGGKDGPALMFVLKRHGPIIEKM